MAIRPIEKQFEAKRVAEIKKIKKEYDNLRMILKGDSAGYMISGISRSLETGILIGALSLAFSFLDMFVHDLAILQKKEDELNGNHLDDEDPFRFSGKSLLPFERYIKGFTRNGMIEDKDGKEILLIYRNIGIPLHHILSRHIGSYSRPLILGEGNLFDRFLTRNLGVGDLHQIEGMIEDYATKCLKLIVSFIHKYHKVYEVQKLEG
jgi:hypothetical protein